MRSVWYTSNRIVAGLRATTLCDTYPTHRKGMRFPAKKGLPMIRFECDYLEGAHPRVLEKLVATNLEQTPVYGLDGYCETARALIRADCGAPDADVHFLTGGTQTNIVMLSSALRPHQGIISPEAGHIAVHETGAIEATGHKVLAVPGGDGKLYAETVEAIHAEHFGHASREHAVQPALVYISQSTENGLVYTRTDLEALSAACRRLGLYLVVDGARLGYGLASPDCDLTMRDMARLCDMFSIGGTKVGALFGEAVVIANDSLKKDFRYIIKQRGGMLAKGRLLGLQFAALFEDGLYHEISRHAVTLALEIRDALTKHGVRFLYGSPTNQQFPVFPDRVVEALRDSYTFGGWERIDPSTSAVRICTSWATRPEHVERLIKDIIDVL